MLSLLRRRLGGESPRTIRFAVKVTKTDPVDYGVCFLRFISVAISEEYTKSCALDSSAGFLMPVLFDDGKIMVQLVEGFAAVLGDAHQILNAHAEIAG